MTNSTLRLLLAATLLCGWLGRAAAQDVDASDMVRGGMQAIQMIDEGKAGELWDGASVVARKRMARDDFLGRIAKSRASLGTARMRTWVAVDRRVLADPDAKAAGQYISIEYETRFAKKPDATLRELVSFHLDGDRIWRFSGYVLR